MRSFVSNALSVSLVVAFVSGCGSSPISNSSLGKVVVYRNGVAYFEREARVEGESLVLSVPREKVDDFLKSLTVRDKASGKSLPISFPSAHPGQGQDGMIEMVIQLPVADGTDVVLSYITESPAWKPSYRIALRDDDTVVLEGWAIVDNTSGENWRDVIVGVGSSSALSFRYDLWSIRDVQRQSLSSSERFAAAPPTGASPYGEAKKPETLTQLEDEEIVVTAAAPTIDATGTTQGLTLSRDYTKNIPVPGRTFDSSMESAAGSSASTLSEKEKRKREEARRIAEEKRLRAEAESRARREKNQRRNLALAEQIRRHSGPVIIEGYARLGDEDAEASSLARANLVRNQLIGNGAPPALVVAKGMGAREGVPPGVRVVKVGSAGEGDAESAPVGESHFGASGAMTVERGTSAMVSIVKEETKGAVVYLYDAESERGNDRFAFKAVRLSNPTDNTLEAGPVTVYGESRFIGEGLTEPIPPHSVALIPFALDRQVIVEKTRSHADRIASLVRISRGVVTTEVEHSRETRLELTNRMNKPVVVYVRHTVTDGWLLKKAPTNVERLGKAHLFAVRLAPSQSKSIEIVESTPMQKVIELGAEESLEMLHAFLTDSKDQTRLAARVEPLLALHREMTNDMNKIDSLRERLLDYRARLDELHGQIFSLKAVKSGGSLMRHLKSKLKEISNKVQSATIELVDTQEHLMLARIQFQDAIADLSLTKALAEPAVTKN